MDRDESKYSIGEIAKICNVTKKQLRYYDEKDIVSPFYKDEQTGYRYYSETQIEEILLIKELKKTDLPLVDIAEILKERNIPLLRKKMERQMELAKLDLLEAMNRYDQTVQTFMRASETVEALDRMNYTKQNLHKFEVVTFPKTKVAYTRYVSYWNANSLFIGRRAELYRMIDEYRLTTTGNLTAIFHGGYMKQFSEKEEDMNGDLEVFFGISDSKDCVSCRYIPEFQAITTLHVGCYPSLKECYEELEIWAKDNGYEVEKCSFEDYICGVTMTNDQRKYVTRVYVPLKGSII